VVPIAEYATQGITRHGCQHPQDRFLQSNAVLLSHHGSLTVGRTLEEALIAWKDGTHRLPYFIAKSFGKVIPIPC